MNLLASYDWLKEFVDLQITPEELAARVSLSGPGVERLYPQAPLYEGLVVGHIKTIQSHPNADKLHIATVDIGHVNTTIVCGGSNLAVDQWVVVALPGARVRWHGEGEPIELALTEIRGVTSQGMICAANEIGLFDAFPHREREILDLGLTFKDEIVKFKAGQSLASFLGLEHDVVMDVEVTTNRPDAMGMVGLAREAAAILKVPLLLKEGLGEVTARLKEGREPLSVQVAEPKLCPRWMCVRVDGVKVKPSPWWLKRRLLAAGQRPINNVVDITNYVLLELGRPLHVFDAEKIQGGLEVRFAKPGESLQALDGKTYELAGHHLVIADENGPQSIPGIMGGEKSGATLDTISVIFECAVWDPTYVRKTARELNLMSDSQALFEKGLSTESVPGGLARALELCMELAGGQVASRVIDIQAQAYRPAVFTTTVAEVRTLMGVTISTKEIEDTLTRLGFAVTVTGERVEATVPWWRDHDIESGRDLVEEVARVYGYANIPPSYPPALTPQPIRQDLQWEMQLRELARASGYTELYTYSFISRDLAERAGFDTAKMLRVQNPLTQEFEFMRTSLLPSLLQVVAENQERFREQRLFEVANVYYLKDGHRLDLPDEQPECVAAVLGGDRAFAEAKGFAEHVLREFGISGVHWRALSRDAFWHPGRTAQAFLDGHLIVTVGEIHPLLAETFKLEGRLACVHMPLPQVFTCASHAKSYKPLPIFPEAKRDVAFIVDRDATVAAITACIQRSSQIVSDVEWFDTYRGQGVPEDKKSLAFHLTFSTPDRTLEAAEVDAAVLAIENALTSAFHAEWRR